MHYFVRIGGMIAGLLIGSAVLSQGLLWAMSKSGLTIGVSGVAMFAGFLVAGLVGAVMTKDSWFYA